MWKCAFCLTVNRGQNCEGCGRSFSRTHPYIAQLDIIDLCVSIIRSSSPNLDLGFPQRMSVELLVQEDLALSDVAEYFLRLDDEACRRFGFLLRELCQPYDDRISEAKSS